MNKNKNLTGIRLNIFIAIFVLGSIGIASVAAFFDWNRIIPKPIIAVASLLLAIILFYVLFRRLNWNTKDE